MSAERKVEQRTWGFAGPVARRFEFDRSPIAVIVGPTGGGKTIAAARRCLRAALWQHPSPRDGWRRARIYVVCPTYRIAWDSVIPSYLKVFPKEVKTGAVTAVWKGAQGDPANHIVQWHGQGPDGLGPVEIDVRIRAVQDVDLDEFFRGKECTAFWLPEFDTHKTRAILSYCVNRIGRFPEPDDRPEAAETTAYSGVWGDSNTPTIGHWFQTDFYSVADEKLGDQGIRIHKQPPGYDPDTGDGFHVAAENRGNLAKIRPDYYRNMAAGMEDHDVRRLLRCQLTYGRLGKPVHPSFDATVHVSKTPLEYDPDLVLVIGIDVDFHGAATFGQRGPFGGWKVLAEVCALDSPDGEMDALEFGDAIVAVRQQRFPRVKRAIIVMDPAGKNRSHVNRRLSFGAELQARTKMTVVPAQTNDPRIRRTSLERPLKRRNGLIIDPSCTRLITALNGGMHYPEKGGVTTWVVKKNDYSAIGESCEYMTMGGEGLEDRAGLVPTLGLSDPAASNVIEVVFD